MKKQVEEERESSDSGEDPRFPFKKNKKLDAHDENPISNKTYVTNMFKDRGIVVTDAEMC